MLLVLTFTLPVFLSSCSKGDYLNAIPENSIAVLAVDLQKIMENNSNDESKLNILKSLIMVEDLSECGIDVSEKLYVFETVDGNIGFVAKVTNAKDLDSWLNNMASNGYFSTTVKRKDFRFTVIKDSWVAGFSSNALLVMGPVLPTRQAEMQKRIAMYLDQDEDKSIKVSPLFERLDNLNAQVSMVAQAAALPDKFVAPFILGAPKTADASQIMIAAELNAVPDVCLEVTGETFSFNKDIDIALKNAAKTFRPINGKYIESMPSAALVGVFMNVDGKQFIDILHSNAYFSALLAGLNTVIDMDNIIKSVDGDLSIVIPEYTEKSTIMQMSAQLGSKDFLNDVDYWKQSCPKGSKIEDWGKNAYFYTDGCMSYYFGVSDDMQYYSGSTPNNARQSINKTSEPLSLELQKRIIGQRMCMLFNLSAFDTVKDIIEPLFGDVNTVIYSVK